MFHTDVITADQIAKVKAHLEALEADKPGAITGQAGYVSMQAAAEKLCRMATANHGAADYFRKILSA